MGGDLRNIKLARVLADDGNKVYTYGIERAEELKTNNRVIFCENLNEIICEEIEVIIGPIPFSKDKININTPFSDRIISIKELINNLEYKKIIAGSISSDIFDLFKNRNIEIIDIMQREELAILNTIATAEGTIEIAISNTDKIIHGSNVLVLGFGRVGKTLSEKLKGLSANITCVARKEEDLAWIKTYGYTALNMKDLNSNLSEYDIIINTIPHMVLNKENLQNVKKECLLIDLASTPGGIDRKEAEKRKIKLIWALALPGKVASLTTAEFIKDTIYNVLKEKNIMK